MKKILLAGLLAISSTGALFATPVQADDDDDWRPRYGQRDRDYDFDERFDRPGRGPRRDNDFDRDYDRNNRPGGPGYVRPGRGNGRNKNKNKGRGRDKWRNGNGDWRPGNGYGRPGNGGWRPGNGNGRPGNGDWRPDNGDWRPGNGDWRPDNGDWSPGDGNWFPGDGGYYNGNQNLDEVARRIEQALRADGELGRFRLGTDTVRNTIELEGRVQTNNQRLRAVSIARNIGRGVPINANRLQVRF